MRTVSKKARDQLAIDSGVPAKGVSVRALITGTRSSENPTYLVYVDGVSMPNAMASEGEAYAIAEIARRDAEPRKELA